MRRATKSFAEAAANAWGPWAAVRFPTKDARDHFLLSVAHSTDSGWAAQAMTSDGLGAEVRWRPGSFLRLNDVAYAHGGRIVVEMMRHRLA
jgi:hypothetical protein